MHRARKRFGQHFLRDDHVIQHIIDIIAARPQQHLVEIGPGQGAITNGLLASQARLDIIEIDRDLVAALAPLQSTHGQLTLHQADALKFDYCSLMDSQQPLRVVGNLPYNISTPLLFHLLQARQCIQDMTFMLQKEVVDRITATSGGKQYGRLSVMLQYYCAAESLFTIGPEAFNPPPKVDSAIVRLVPYTVLPYPADNEKLFAQIVSHSFSQRRKTLRKSLQQWLSAEQLQKLDIDPGSRAEQLDVAGFVRMANAINT